MASKLRCWRARVESGLAAAPPDDDPKAILMARVDGRPSAELEAALNQRSQPAAVLLALIDRPGGPQILLTERAGHLPHHAGQISFPGGRFSPVDESPIATALREAEEEVGLEPHRVEVLGSLSPQLTGTGFCIFPVVGWVEGGFEPVPDPAEVAEVFEVPFEHLLAPVNFRRSIRERWGTRFLTDEYLYGHRRIWGATAAILSRFIEIIDGKTKN